ncbi:coiled-coil and C2 domain-containing protein 1A [Microcaecilia unicolor]|uniref:Coiled-coil and C2 domain-containing protein 1B n=1 Tax=Microcaecilia unicolor TaxID=1415580 RepID=A0A6P7XB00_9AMPH|nr:coiled-coil and C2 domain-containing protein 1A [Microcaecilia unicolor]XP_030052758.1 coiled-coil and C2 domain-containing protein 1A [Microcaecilia unicolor]
MGLLLDFSPEGMMMGSHDEDVESDGDLEAELLSLTGEKSAGREKPRGKAPLPMEHIERMAALCMKDLDEDTVEDDEDVEADEDLLAELGEVLGEGDTPAPSHPTSAQLTAVSTGSNGLESTVTERLEMYRTAINNAKQAGESSKARRYERGLKTLQDMHSLLMSGRSVNQEDLPPPVALGKNNDSKEPPAIALSPAKLEEAIPSHQAADTEQTAAVPSRTPPPILLKPRLLLEAAVVRPTSASAAPQSSFSKAGSEDVEIKATLLGRQREYKLAALQAKQQGDRERATTYYRIAKVLDPILAALEKGEPVDMSNLPPPLDQLPERTKFSAPPCSAPPPIVAAGSPTARAPEIPPPPRDVLEALQQRMDRYRAAAAQAKEKGDERKGRMHERIVKQYQEAIRTHKAGKAVDFSELPVPPGFPPIQGMEPSADQQCIAGVLESAMKLANQEADEGDEESYLHPAPGRAALKSPSSKTPRAFPAVTAPQKTGTKAQQQLNFLEGRKKQLMQAALRAKQKNDIEGAKIFLRQAKGLEPMIEASQNGLPVDITKVPQAPVNEEDFTLVQHRGQTVHPKTTAQYVELMELLRQQHEMCISYSKQFTHLGNITETSKFEKMAEECKKNIEVVKQAHAKGFPLPKYHYEQRTISTVKIFPDLTNNDMILFVVKGINLPAPSGTTPDDLDAFVRFEFLYPNTEEAQRDKTNVVKSTNCPVFKEQFKLFINRGHRGLKRAIQAKGIKFEIVHKGGLFKQDRVVGTAHLKLEALETNCEIREIIEVMDGRRSTGGKIEVMIRIREPLSSQQLDTTTEKWLVIDPLSMPSVALPKPQQRPIPMKGVGSRPGFTLQSLNVLAFEKERLEKKIQGYRQAQRQPPNELMNQYRDIVQHSQWQRVQLERGGQAVRREYAAQLEKYLQLYTEATRRWGQEGNREAAKEALYKRNLVESELQKMWR